MFAGHAAEEMQAKIDQSVDRIADRLWSRVLMATVAIALLMTGMALVLITLGLLIEPHVGSAAAFAVIGAIVLAAGGGLLHMQRRR